MSRPKKKPNYNPDQVMQEFMAAVADAFGSYDDREDTTFPGLNAVAAEFGITALKARKLLITAGVYSTALSRQVAELYTDGAKVDQIMKLTGLSRASVHSYLPYTKIPYKLDELSANAERIRLYRERKRNVRSFSRAYQLWPDSPGRNKKMLVEHADLSPRLCVPHCKRTEVHLQNQRRRDVRQSEIQVDHTGNGIHGVSESDGAWRSRCRTEEVGNLWSQLPVSDLCKAGSNTWGRWMSPICIRFV